MILLTDDKVNEYCVYKSELIADNQSQFVAECHRAKNRFDMAFPKEQTTARYRHYNFFALTAGFPLYHDLLNELRSVVYGYMNADQKLWFQCWFNYHDQAEVLPPHTHRQCTTHGYIVIDPRKTRTVFDDYEIRNEVGMIYIGKPHKSHGVVVDEPFEGKRITVAFDIYTEDDCKNGIIKSGDDFNLSIFPLN
jgi:hypothetical protein